MNRQEQIEFLKKLNDEHSALYSNPGESLARKLYRAKHPTEIAALKCMDGRIHIPVATNTPLGIIQPWRNIGGKFDMGWPHFQLDICNWVRYAVAQGRQCLILVTYHYSRGHKHRGCAGYDYDQELAFNETKKLKAQIERVFGKDHKVVYPVLFGFETDLDAVILNGENGEQIDLSELKDGNENDLRQILRRLYPDMSAVMLNDFLPLVVGNIAHIEEVRQSNRPLVDIEHREWVLAVGRGFDWLHEPNTALIVGPYSPNLDVPIEKAAGIIKGNLEAGRVDTEGFTLLCSAIYRETSGVEPLLAREKALFLERFASEVIGEKFSDFSELMNPLAVVVDMNTRKMYFVKE
jgi:hypothetical protein